MTTLPAVHVALGCRHVPVTLVNEAGAAGVALPSALVAGTTSVAATA